MQCYERHKQGIMEKEEYLSKREALTQRSKNIEQEIAIIDDKIQENTALRHHLNVDKLKEAVAKWELVLDWINEVIDKIYVYDKDRAAGYLHSMAVKSDSSLWSWGYNGYGQLGDGTVMNRTTPVQVKGGESEDEYLTIMIKNYGQ